MDKKPLILVAVGAVVIAAILMLGPSRSPTSADEGAEATATEAAPAEAAEAAPAEVPAFLLTYRVSHERWGSETLEVRPGGHVAYSLEAPGRPPVHAELSLDGEELGDLEEDVLAAHPCEVRGTREEAHENESRPTMTFGLPDATCELTLFFDEWHELPEARPLLSIVNDLRVALASSE